MRRRLRKVQQGRMANIPTKKAFPGSPYAVLISKGFNLI
jgi:hypothetical protein